MISSVTEGELWRKWVSIDSYRIGGGHDSSSEHSIFFFLDT